MDDAEYDLGVLKTEIHAHFSILLVHTLRRLGSEFMGWPGFGLVRW